MSHQSSLKHAIASLLTILLFATIVTAEPAQPAKPFVQVTQWDDKDWSTRITHQSDPNVKDAFVAEALEKDGQPAPAISLRFTLEPATPQKQAFLGTLLLHQAVYSPADSGAITSITVTDVAKTIKSKGRIVCRIAVVQDGRVFTNLNENFDQTQWTSRTFGPLQAKDFGELDPDSTDGGMNRKSNPDFSAKGTPMQFGVWRSLRTSRAAGLTYQEAIDNWTVTLNTDAPPAPMKAKAEVDDRLRNLSTEQQRSLALAAMERFDRDYDERRYLDRNDNRTLIWNQSKLMQGYAWAYEASGDPTYLDRLFAHASEVWARRSDRQGVSDELRNRLMPAWCTAHYTKNKQHALLAGAGMLTYPMLYAAYLTQSDPQLAARYANVSRQAVLEAVESLDAFEDSWVNGPADDEGYYKDFRLPDKQKAHKLMASLSEGPNAAFHIEPFDVLPLPFNMQNAAGRSYVMLWLLTGETRFRERAQRLARFFHRRMNTDGDAYVWPYGVHRDPQSAEDTSHAGLNVEFALLCHRAGLVFTDDDITRLSATAKRISLGSAGLRSYVDGSDRKFPRAPMLYAWLGLGQHDPEFRLRALAWYEQDWSTGGSREGQAGAGGLAASTLPPTSWRPLPAPMALQ